MTNLGNNMIDAVLCVGKLPAYHIHASLDEVYDGHVTPHLGEACRESGRAPRADSRVVRLQT